MKQCVRSWPCYVVVNRYKNNNDALIIPVVVDINQAIDDGAAGEEIWSETGVYRQVTLANARIKENGWRMRPAGTGWHIGSFRKLAGNLWSTYRLLQAAQKDIFWIELQAIDALK